MTGQGSLPASLPVKSATNGPGWPDGAAPSGNPGPLCSNLTGNDAGKLPCPVMIIPGSLSAERIENLS